MSSFRIRPRFKHLIENTEKAELEKHICDELRKTKQFVFTHIIGHIYIKIHPKEQHVWSPQLHLSFEQEGENMIVRGLYGPNPTVWAFFFFGYVGLGILTLFAGMWGTSLWSLGKEATVLWFVPLFGVLASGLYIVSQAGQKLGAQQMFDIHHFYEGVSHNKIVVS
ncbi:MAG: hypothetical protein ABJG41_00845 [Cyclobacteriaceae bacterium]